MVGVAQPGGQSFRGFETAGLGPRDTQFGDALGGRLEPLTFLDLDRSLVDRALAREREQRRSGPIAEGMLRDLGVVAARID